MKITKSQLKQIIKEELETVMTEVRQMQYYEPEQVEQYLPKVYDEFGAYIEGKVLTIALQHGSGEHFYKIGDPGDPRIKFQPIRSFDPRELPAETDKIRSQLKDIPKPKVQLQPEFELDL